MLPPAYPPRKIDPEQQLRDVEDDPTSQWLWDLLPKVASLMQRLNQPFDAREPETHQQPATDS